MYMRPTIHGYLFVQDFGLSRVFCVEMKQYHERNFVEPVPRVVMIQSRMLMGPCPVGNAHRKGNHAGTYIYKSKNAIDTEKGS